MSLDKSQLTARFKTRFDTFSNNVLTMNKPATVVDKSKPWCRFSVSLGDRDRETLGEEPEFLQLGGVYLQVFVPKALGADGGDALIQTFDDLFCDWQSDDGAITMGRMTRNVVEDTKEGIYQHTVRFAFRSIRKRS